MYRDKNGYFILCFMKFKKNFLGVVYSDNYVFVSLDPISRLKGAEKVERTPRDIVYKKRAAIQFIFHTNEKFI